MARNIAGYISNLGKSVAYSTLDKVKSMSPTAGEFTSTNAELFKTMYSNIRDYKGTYTRGMDLVKKSKVYEAADLGIKSIFEDIKTGKFYNKEREDKIASKIMGFGNESDSFGSFDMGDDGFDIGDDDDFGSFDESSITTGDKVVAASIMDSSRSNAEMISMSVASSAEHITKTQKASTHLLYTQNMQAYNLFNNNLNAINSNLSNILSASQQTAKVHVENTTKFFQRTEELMTQQVSYLKQIAENTTPRVEEAKKEAKKRLSFGDITSANGTPDLKEYFNIIKRNISEQMGSIGAINSMFGEDSNALLSFVSSPLKFIPNLIVNKMVPNTLEKSMEQFDKTLSGFFGSLIAKFNTMAKDEENIFTSTIGKIFGIRNGVKSSLETNNYNKGKVDWDGKSRKALIEVIPTQLAKIVSLLSGKREQIFDYDSGKFIDSKSIEDEFKNMRKTNVKRATGDMRDVFDKFMQNLTFNSLNEKESLEEDIEKFFEQMYSSGEIFDLNGKDAKDGYLKYGISPKSFSVIRSMFKKAQKDIQLSLNKQIIEYREAENKKMQELELQGDSIYQYRFNNSNLGEFIEKDKKNGGYKSKSLLAKGGILEAIDNKGKNVFFYLQNIYKELSFIRRFGGGSMSSNTDNIEIITSDGKFNTIEKHTLDEIEIKDTSKKSLATKEREERERKIAAFERAEKRRRDKNKNLINVSDIDDETRLEHALSQRIDINNIKDKLEENKDKKKSMIDKLLEAESISGKMEVVVNNLNRLTKKPMEFITNTIDKVDQRMYEVIYGKENYKGKDVKGFIDVMVLELKSTFGKFNLWLDEKVLTPLKEKLDIESFGDIGKKFLGMFGIDAEDIGERIKEYLFDKDKGLFSGIVNSTKQAFKNAFNTVKQSMKDAYGPLFGKIKSNFKTKTKFDSLDEIQEIEGNVDKPWEEMTPEEKLHEIQRQQGLGDVIGTHNTSAYKAKDYYKNFTFDYSKTNPLSHKNHLLAEIKNSQFSKMTREQKEKLLEKLMDEYTDPKKSSRQSLLGMINRLQYELDNEDKILDIDRYMEKEDSIKKRKEARDFGTIKINEDYFNRPRKSAKELYEMFPNLVSSPEIAQSIKDNEDKISGGLFNKIFDKVTQGIDILKDMRDSLISIVKSITPDNTKGFTRPSVFNNSIKTPFSSNPLLREEEGAINDFAKELGAIISGSIANYMHGKLNKFADGGYVSEAQVATIGKGEVVLSKENVDNLVKVLSGVMDGVEKSKAKSANKLYGSLKDLDKELGGFSDLSFLEQLLNEDNRVSGKYGSLSDSKKQDLSSVINAVSKQLEEDRNTQVDEKGLPVDPVKRAAFLETRPYLQQVGDEFVKAVGVTRNALFGDTKEDTKSLGIVIDDLTTNITKYAPEAIGSGLLGAGVSLITGAFGGPLLGAAVGAGISLTKNSEKVQDWLFGEKDKDGERTGGALSKNFMKSVSKYLPDFKTYGIAGAATGLLPLVPFGPIGGLMLGSAYAFAKNNESVQEALFGGKEHSLMKPETKEKLKKMLPRMGLGAAIGTFAGPFGFLGNAIVGSGIGMLTSTQKFNDLILGIKDKEGKYQGGLLPTIRDTIVDPIRGYMKGIGKRVSTFIQDHMLKPLASAIEPLKKTVELSIKNVFKGVQNTLNYLFEKSFGVTLNKLIEDKLVKPVADKLTKFLFKPLKEIGKFVISSPFKAIGAIGNSVRKAHIRQGNADYMTAEERVKFRKDKNIYNFGIFGEDRFASADESMVNMSQDQLNGIVEQLKNIRSTDEDNYKLRKESAYDMARDVMSHFGYTESRQIMKHIKEGNIEDVFKYTRQIQNNPKLKQETKYKLIKSLNTKYEEFKKREEKRLSDINNKQSIYEKLKEQGFNVNDKNIDKYIALLSKESKLRDKKEEEKPVEEKQLDLAEKNHNEIVSLFREAIDAIKGIDSEDSESKESDKKEEEKKDGSGLVKAIEEETSKNEDSDISEESEEYVGKRNIFTRIADKLTRKFKKNTTNGNIIEHIDDDGTIRKYKRDYKGELVPDTTDQSTVNELKEERKEEKNKNIFYEKFSSFVDHTKERAQEGLDSIKEKGKGVFSGIKDFFSGANLAKIAMLGTAIMSIPGAGDMIVTLMQPIVNAGVTLISNAIPLIIDGVKQVLPNIIKNSSTIINSVAENIGYDDGTSEAVQNAGAIAGRHILTGGKLKGGKFLSNWVSSKPKKGLIKKTLSFAIKTPLKYASRAVESSAKLVNKIYSKTTDKLFNKSTISTILEKGKKVAPEAAEQLTENTGMIESIKKSIIGLIEKLLKSNTVRNLVGADKCDSLIKKFVPQLTKELGERAAKTSTKTLTKVLGGLSTGGLLNVAWAIADFVSGFNDAKDILGIVDEPTLGMKITTGLLKGISGLCMITAFIPEKTWVNMFLDIILPICGEEDSKIQQMREKARQEVDKYVKDNNIKGDMTVEEYNNLNKKSFWQKTGSFIKKVGSGISNYAKNSWNRIVNWNSTDYLLQQNDIMGLPMGYGDINLAGNGDSNKSQFSVNKKVLNIPKSSERKSLAGNGNSFYDLPSNTLNALSRAGNKGLAGNGVSSEDMRYLELNAPIKESITAKDINDWVNPIVKNKSGSAMQNIGDTAMKAYEATGLDPRYLVAHAAWESGWGTSHYAKTRNNFFGIGAFNSNPDKAKTFSKDEGFIDGAKWINHNFTKEGQNTLDSMVNEPTGTHRYAVYDDGSPNEGWVKGISSIMAGSKTITSGSVNKNAKWSGNWPSSDYESSGSSAIKGSNNTSVDNSESTTEEDNNENDSIFNIFKNAKNPISNSINKIFGVDIFSSSNSSTSSKTSNSNSSTDNTSVSSDTTANRINDFVYYSQKEEPWASHNYNLSPGNYQAPGRNVSIARRGCGPTSAAMVIRQLTGDTSVTPATMADLSTSTGSSVDAGTAWDFFARAGSKYGLNVTQLGKSSTVDYLPNATPKTPIILSGTGGVNGSRAPFYGGHFVVGVKGTKDSITINDPVGKDTSKTYKISDLKPLIAQGWTFDRGGGNGEEDSKPKKELPKQAPIPKAPKITIPKEPKVKPQGNGANDNSSSRSYDSILLSIVKILMNISENSGYLSKILDVLTEKLGIKVPEDTKKSIQTNSSNSKQQIVNVIKQAATESDPENSYLLGLLDTLAKQ